MTIQELISMLCDIADDHGRDTQVMVTGHDGRRMHGPVPINTITIHRPMVTMYHPLGHPNAIQGGPMEVILEP